MISNDLRSTPRISHQEMIKAIRAELRGATWQYNPAQFARILSAKTRKREAPPLSLRRGGPRDMLDNYDIVLDKWSEASDYIKRSKFDTPNLPLRTDERSHYGFLCDYLNTCLRQCQLVLQETGLPRGEFYKNLKFVTWDKQMKDGVVGAHAIKPDIAGISHSKDSAPRALWWVHPSGQRSNTLEIPVEVKNSWPNLVAQAGTYARCLFSSVPFRRSSLVFGFNHKMHELRFLNFHAGGLTSSKALPPTNPDEHKAILCLFLSLLTWNTAGDAGIPEWDNNKEIFIQTTVQDRKGVRMRVKQVYYNRIGIRGRSGSVLRLELSDPNPSPVLIAEPRSPEDHIRRYRHPHEFHFVSQPLDLVVAPIDTRQLAQHDGRSDIISKYAWVEASHATIEKDMFQECGGKFGVIKHHYSNIVHHKKDLPATNHLELEGADYWELFADEPNPPDLRVLMQHTHHHGGESLVSADTPKQLFVAVAHSMLGYLALMERGYHHRDVSIGNLLLHKIGQSVQIDDNDSKSRVLPLLKQYNISDRCHGFIIDGDMAVHLGQYFKEDHMGTRSGTQQFMSRDLLDAAALDKGYLQSSVDDGWSFYYVAQWGAAYKENEDPPPVDLAHLRDLLAGSHHLRDSGTYKITGRPLTAHDYGRFLSDCQPLLVAWHSSLTILTGDWHSEVAPMVQALAKGEDRDPFDHYYPLFLTYTERFVKEYLALVQHYFPGSLQGGGRLV